MGAMSDRDVDGTLDGFDVPEDDGELDPSESLLSDPGQRDPDQGPVDAPEGYRGATAFGVTERETRTGQSLSALLRREQPELSDDGGVGDEQYESDGTDDGPDPYWTREESDLGGVLASVDDRHRPPLHEDQVAQRVGQEGVPAAEDEAVHLIPPA